MCVYVRTYMCVLFVVMDLSNFLLVAASCRCVASPSEPDKALPSPRQAETAEERPTSNGHISSPALESGLCDTHACTHTHTHTHTHTVHSICCTCSVHMHRCADNGVHVSYMQHAPSAGAYVHVRTCVCMCSSSYSHGRQEHT